VPQCRSSNGCRSSNNSGSIPIWAMLAALAMVGAHIHNFFSMFTCLLWPDYTTHTVCCL
jgi:hypothetical protein